MRYPSEFIEQLRNRVSVSDIVSKHVQLRRAGRELTGLCPFHKEKTPSFTVNDEKGFYHCFGCGAHGDAIGFIKEYENVSYKEAIERLANEVGLALPKLSREAVAKEEKMTSLQEVCELACQWFQAQFFADAGREARRYAQERGLAEGVVDQFRIGYAPADRHGLESALKEKNISSQMLVQSGLSILVDGKQPYARFRDRLMFPIRNRRGQVVAFGGRLLRPDPNGRAPKYLNSPETELFHKGHMLYNLDLAQRSARDGQALIIAEGYTDVIALHEAGVPAVAPLGTALTADQLCLLWRVTDAPILCLDGDNAGQRAMDRAINTALPLLEPGKSLQILSLPAGEDPDTLLKLENGEGIMRDHIAGAQDIADTLWSRQEAALQNTPANRAVAEQSLMHAADQIQHPQMRTHMRQYFKEKIFQLSKKSYIKNNNQKDKGKSYPKQTFGNKGEQASVLKALIAKKINAAESAAQELLRCVCNYPGLLLQGEVEELLASISFSDSKLHHAQQACFSLLSTASAKDIEEMKGDDFSAQFKAVDLCFSATSNTLYETRSPQLLWKQAENAYMLQLIAIELQVAQKSMAQEMSEESMQYFQALVDQRTQLERQRNALMEQQLASGE